MNEGRTPSSPSLALWSLVRPCVLPFTGHSSRWEVSPPYHVSLWSRKRSSSPLRRPAGGLPCRRPLLVGARASPPPGLGPDRLTAPPVCLFFLSPQFILILFLFNLKSTSSELCRPPCIPSPSPSPLSLQNPSPPAATQQSALPSPRANLIFSSFKTFSITKDRRRGEGREIPSPPPALSTFHFPFPPLSPLSSLIFLQPLVRLCGRYSCSPGACARPPRRGHEACRR